MDNMAILMTLGLLKFPRMSFGVKNVHLLLGDPPFASFLYMDNVIVGSESKDDHIRDLRSLFQRLNEMGFLLNKKKCKLGRSAVTFLGHVFDSFVNDWKPSLLVRNSTT